ncbi:MAG TPA: MATE family efflux transporter [Oligoflexus sp.]|uniref:MATE family efflux transporter n=1 Tax=Oligoflexus sp. TaxID=1971216 RepID=UPI002D4B8D08|nr:MATE family efflux transporter [Oligoflexus sp.]HYX39395.1 MATE family efflux transporter [Oligoflexus sp.]
MQTKRTDRWKTLLRLAWPLIIANSFWNLQLTIDRVFLGQYSTEALAAAMAVMGVFWTPMALLQQTAAYLMTFVAQYFGAKETRMIGPAVWQALYLSVAGGLLFLGLIPMADTLFTMIGHSSQVRPLEVEYFQAICYSALPTALVAACSSFFSGLGNTRTVMWINCVGLIANVILDYVMIFGKFGFPAWGVAGAGYATALATWCSAIYALYLVFQKKHEQDFAVRSGWQVNWSLMKRYLRFGLPSGLQWALEGLAFTVFLIFVGRMTNGDAALASSGIVVTVMMLAVLPPMGVAQAVSIQLGQYLGDKKADLAEACTWSGLQLSLMYIFTVGLTFLLFPHFYLNWFHNPTQQDLWNQVSIIVPYLLMYVALFTCFDSMNLIFSFALKGAGDTRFVTLVALTVPWPLMVAPTWFIKDWDGAVYWAWGAASFYIIFQSFIFLARFKGGKWKSMSVIHG